MFYSNIVYLLITCVLLYKWLKKDFDLMHVLVFVIPFHGWNYNLGLSLYVNQIVILMMIISATVSSSCKNNVKFNVGNKWIIVFLFYAFIVTLLMSNFFIENYLQLGGFFRSQGRFLSQLFLLLILFSLVPLSFSYIKTIKEVPRYIKIYLYALIVLTIIGWVQFFTYYLAGFDPFPIIILDGNARYGMYVQDGIKMFRMSSLGGEPKGFSMSLILGFFIIHIFNKYNIKFFKYDILLKYLLLFTAFATLSTSAIVLFVILLFISLIYGLVTFKNKIKLNSKDILYSFFIFCIVTFFTIKYGSVIYDIIQHRVFERDILKEDYDAPIMIFFAKFPVYLFFGSGLGNIHNLAAPYIPSEFAHYMTNTIFVAKTGYLHLISELGIFGFTLFIGIFYSIFARLSRIGKYFSLADKNIIQGTQLLLVIVLIAYLARVYVVNELMLFLSFANVLVYSKTIRKKNTL